MKILISIGVVLVLIIGGWAGTRGQKFSNPPIEVFPDMDRQAKLKYQAPSGFFQDGRAGRLPVAGTVPYGLDKPNSGFEGKETYQFTNDDSFLHTGRIGDVYGDGFPEEIEVNEALLKRGQERFNIYCAVCHGEAGNGKGVVSKFSVALIANLIDKSFYTEGGPAYRPTGSIYETITKGKGLMGSYGANLPVNDRWAVVAYLKSLQLAAEANGVN